MSISLPNKSPGEILDYEIDWTSVLKASETIVTSTWSTSSPAGLTIDSNAIVSGNKKTVIWLSGGTTGVKYELINTIVTNNVPARTYQTLVIIKVLNKT